MSDTSDHAMHQLALASLSATNDRLLECLAAPHTDAARKSKLISVLGDICAHFFTGEQQLVAQPSQQPLQQLDMAFDSYAMLIDSQVSKGDVPMPSDRIVPAPGGIHNKYLARIGDSTDDDSDSFGWALGKPSAQPEPKPQLPVPKPQQARQLRAKPQQARALLAKPQQARAQPEPNPRRAKQQPRRAKQQPQPNPQPEPQVESGTGS